MLKMLVLSSYGHGEMSETMRQIPVETISDILALDPKPRSYEELDQLAASGLKKSALISCVSTLCQDECDYNRILYQLVSKEDLLSERDYLTPDESMRVVRLAKILALTRYVWSSDEDAKLFMNHAHPMLDDKTPIEAACTEVDTRRVEEVLWEIFYGIVV